MKTVNLKFFHLNVLIIILFLFGATGCNLPTNSSDTGTTGSEAGFTDENAQPYRMFFSTESDFESGTVQIRQFIGQIRIVDLENIFGDLNSLPRDASGNISAVIIDRGALMYLTITPDFKGVNLVASDQDGTISSVFDLDGDGIVDVADIRFGNGGWMYLVTEQQGLDLFRDWVAGLDPTCLPGTGLQEQDQAAAGEEAGIPDFCGGGTSSNESGEGSGSAGGSNDLGSNGIIDPMDIVCAGFPTGSQAALNSRIRGYAEVTSDVWDTLVQNGEDETYAGDTRIVTGTERNAQGDIIRVQKHIYYYDREGRLLQETHEVVGPDGSGRRETTKYFSDGSSSHAETTITTDMDEDGNYVETYPERTTPEHTEGAPPVDEPAGSGGNAGTRTNPGPEGNDGRLAEFCANRGNTSSGAETAAGNDPTMINVGCGDLVGAPSNGDCTIIEWARPEDFAGALDSSGNDGCSEFHQDDGTGNCEPSNAIERMRGRTALIGSIQFDDIVICPPIVCNPAFAEQQEPISQSYQDDISLTDGGTVTNLTLCYQGPGNGYPIISSIQKDTHVTILGIGVEKNWYVIDNPIYYGFPCWVSGEFLSPDDGFNPELFPVIPIPKDRIIVPNPGGNGSSGGNEGSGDGNAPGEVTCGPNEYFSIVTQSCQPFG